MAHYVNNADFLQALKDFKLLVKEAEEQGKPPPQVTNYIGECILKIANHLSYRPNFINYSYRDEMISDGIENCLQFVCNFDPEKSNNPFAYFTQIVFFAFIRRIQREKKQTLIKGKLIMDMPFDAFEVQEHDEDGTFTSSYLEFMQAHGAFEEIVAKEEKRKAKQKKNQPTIEDILVADSDEIEYE